MKNKHITYAIIILTIALTVTSCAPEHYSSHEYGFFGGIWHGFIIIPSLIGKLIGMDIGIYAEHNSGFFYWLGFIIGIGGLGGGGAAARR